MHGSDLIPCILAAGGVLQDALLAKQSAASLRAVLAPKLSGTAGAAAALVCDPVQQHLLFSSVAALMGNPGQSNYAAANAVVDAATQLYQRQGTPAASLQWGPWAGGGMATAAVAARLRQQGVGLVDPSSGLRLLQQLLVSSTASHARPAVTAPVAVLDWERMLRPAQKKSPFFAAVLPAGSVRPSAVAPKPPHARPAAAAITVQKVQQEVLLLAESVLGSSIDPVAAFMTAGLDSLGERTHADIVGLQSPACILLVASSLGLPCDLYVHQPLCVLAQVLSSCATRWPHGLGWTCRQQ